MSQAVDEIKIGGLGASRRRVEDNRFIRGKGNYTDDIVLPGMLHMEILRSPLAHARIRSIDASKAWDIPGVHLVLTGEMMATRNLAWMPTLSYDTQAVLATDKVRFQGQEVACVIADDPYIAKDACEAIDVEYEPLPVIVNPWQAVADGAPVIGDGFGNKVPVYPGYVCSILASILLERPVKWIEDKSGNLISTGFARDIYLDGELALRKDGKILAVRMHADADHGAFFSDAQPSKFKIGLLHSTFACYDVPFAHLTARGTYTNKAPGGVAYRCSFRVTEAMFFQERMMQAAADDLGIDQAEFRRMNFVPDEAF